MAPASDESPVAAVASQAGVQDSCPCAVGWVAQLSAHQGGGSPGGQAELSLCALFRQVLQEGADQRAAGVGVHSLHQADTVLRATV